MAMTMRTQALPIPDDQPNSVSQPARRLPHRIIHPLRRMLSRRAYHHSIAVNINHSNQLQYPILDHIKDKE